VPPEVRRRVLLGAAGVLGSAGLGGAAAGMQYRAGENIGKILSTPQRQIVREGKV
jgi:hypothetical protein